VSTHVQVVHAKAQATAITPPRALQPSFGASDVKRKAEDTNDTAVLARYADIINKNKSALFRGTPDERKNYQEVSWPDYEKAHSRHTSGKDNSGMQELSRKKEGLTTDYDPMVLEDNVHGTSQLIYGSDATVAMQLGDDEQGKQHSCREATGVGGAAYAKAAELLGAHIPLARRQVRI
ncbi:hypothetical protein HK102_007916, partial [Quaeritorhiza haematococci]